MGPGRMACVSRELSKVHEENRHGTLSELHGWYNKNEPKGEIVIVVKGRGKDNEMEE